MTKLILVVVFDSASFVVVVRPEYPMVVVCNVLLLALVARRVIVYAHRDVDSWMSRLEEHRIHRADAVDINVMDRDLVAALVTRLERRMDFDLSVSERHLYLTLGNETLSGTAEARRLAP